MLCAFYVKKNTPGQLFTTHLIIITLLSYNDQHVRGFLNEPGIYHVLLTYLCVWTLWTSVQSQLVTATHGFVSVSVSIITTHPQTSHGVPTLLLTKNLGLFHDFPGSKTPMSNIPGPVWSLRMFKYKEKTAFTHNTGVQSVVHWRKFNEQESTQTGCYTIAACFPLEPLEKCVTFKDIIARLSRTKVIFEDFPGPGIFKKKFRTFQEAWEVCSQLRTLHASCSHGINTISRVISSISRVVRGSGTAGSDQIMNGMIALRPRG